MTSIKAEDLSDSLKFRKLHELQYDGIVPFVFENIKKKTLSSRFYLFINALYLILLIGITIYGFSSSIINLRQYAINIFWSFAAGSFFVIPFHEGFHGLAYKILGASRIHFGADMRQMLFYVAADRFVIDRKGFYMVALAPFSVINLASLLTMFFVGFYGIVFILSFCLLHNVMCIGDFAMISFYQQNKQKELYTYDDHKGRISYIYEKIN